MRLFRLKRSILFTALCCLASSVISSDADIQNLVNQVSQPQYTAYQQAIESMGLGKYAGTFYNQGARGRSFTGGKTGDKGNQETRKYLLETLSGFGLAAAVQGKSYNVVAEQTGALNPNNVFIIAAHYDTIKSNLPGGDGDASGVAAVLEAARVLRQFKFDNTIRFVLFNATAQSARGSNDYVKTVVNIGAEKLLGVVYLDGILHPYHDKNPALPQALSLGIADKTAVPSAWAAAFTAAAQQFVPALPLDTSGPSIVISGDAFTFITYSYLSTLRLSENSSKDIANAAFNTPADASDGTAGAHYDYAFATNVVRATIAMIAKQAGFEGPADSSGVLFPDTDGDGYSDEIEIALESDPALATSTPLNLPQALPSGAFEAITAVVSLDFSIATQDIILVTGYLPVHAGFSPKDSTVIVDIAGVVKAIVLKSNGTGKKGANTFTIKLRNTGGSIPEQLAQFSLTLSQGNFKRQFQPLGLINAPFAGKPVTIPITIIFDNEVRTTQRLLLYTSVKNMTGIAH